MPPQDLATTYAAKADEELLQLAADQDQLMPEALTALLGELTRRRIAAPASSPHKDEPPEQQPFTGAQNVTLTNRVSSFVADVLRLYHTHLSLFIKLTVPAIVIGYIVVMAAGYEIGEISRHFLHGFAHFTNRSAIIEIAVLRVTSYLASGLALSFSYASICHAVDQVVCGKLPSASECSAAVSNRLGAFLRLSLVFFAFICALEMAAGFVGGPGLYWVLHRAHAQATSLIIWLTAYSATFLCLLPVCRLALAMPAVILDDCRIGQALFRSDELTQGRWLVLAALLSKSLIGSYVAGIAPYWIRNWIWSYVQLPRLITVIASIAAVTLVEPTMFIGFALLYVREREKAFTPVSLPTSV
jgi:hypothetical protein